MLKTKIHLLLTVILITYSSVVFAQTSGPSQPEVQSFQPVSITNMVETSTGEFQYNIPLFTIGNYPININYNSRIGMENEASIVGLGFNLNCGAITRQVRGLPDDFQGDIIEKKVNMKPNITNGLTNALSIELVGKGKKDTLSKYGFNITSSAGLFYNNYTGWGIENSVGAGFHGNKGGLSGNAGIGINSNSQHGTSVNPYIGLSYEFQKQISKTIKIERSDSKKHRFDVVKIKSRLGSGAGIDFNTTSYSPKIDFPFKTLSLDFSLKLGVAGSYVQVGGDIKGYRTVQKLETNYLKNPAYGFLYAEQGKLDINALMDFNRENEGVMTEDKPNLPFLFATQDIYAVAGQGIGGTYELKRNNVFIGFDPKTKTNNVTAGGEFELGWGVGNHVGADIRLGYIRNTSQKWNAAQNEFLINTDFNSPKDGTNDAIAEEIYFKNPNDVMFNTNPVYSLSGNKPIAPTLSNLSIFGGRTISDKINMAGTTVNISSNNFVNPNRDNRLDVIYYLNAEEASTFGIQKTIANYVLNNFNDPTQLDRVKTNGRQKNHLSELICLKPDGTRYVFNVPAYNVEKTEVSFSVNEADVQQYEVSTMPNLSGTVSNEGKGKDDFVSVTKTPPYAHSFLLGTILSPNYIDVDDNGPSLNDIGDYVKFNYAKKYDNYYWRSNNQVSKAQADLGMIADKRDAKAFYSEGYKEVWYAHSIETKNEMARFFYSERTDAYDLIDNTKKLMKLDSILIFARPSLNSTNLNPYKRIYFSYNQTLCKGINNNPSLGKLTLEKVYFKNGNSHKGKWSAYKFNYSNTNPQYNTLATDRWGNYKPYNPNQPYISNQPLSLDNKEFPYVNQDITVANQNASAWLLNKIELPNGGAISIDYEAHDYAFVQHKKAMYMTKVIGFSKDIPINSSSLNKNILYNGNEPNNYLIFKLKKTIPSSVLNVSEVVRQDYFTDPNDSQYGQIVGNKNYANLYGKIRVNLDPSFGEEEIPVFFKILECGAFRSNSAGDYDYGYVKLEATNTTSTSLNDANQISKFAWQTIKHNYSQILFGMDADPALSTTESFKAIANMLMPGVGALKSILQTSPYKLLRDKNTARTVNLDKSFIRLYIPDGFKLGGNGARVKQIQIKDNWANMAGSPATSSSYTIKYDYTKKVNDKIISSGVAAYEPESGGDENPWKQPIFYVEKNTLMPDDNEFQMTPLGESLFPSAEIIYSEVKTTQNPITNQNVMGTGYSINEYYTAYDFPTKVSNTQIEIERKPKAQFQLLKNISNDYMASTQGFVVITNDMHGKPKSEATFGDKGNLITAKYYKYKTNANQELDNYVRAINKSNTIGDKLLGVETQTYGDARSFYTESYSGSVHGNLDIQIWGIVPTAAPSFWPDFSFEKKSFCSFTLTKHIRQQGILEMVTTVDKGSTISTKNELWDDKTGAVLLTSTINEFKDPIYNFTYPAHWAYSGMGMASDNISASITNSSLPNITNNFQAGDIFVAGTKKYLVDNYGINTLYSPYNTIQLSSLPNDTKIKIIHSGKKNLATTPVGNIVSLRNPIVNNQLVIDNTTQVIDADATEFRNFSITRKCDTCQINRNCYLLNMIGSLAQWQTYASYKFVGDRQQTNPTLRTDGAITNFNPFWLNSPNTSIWNKTSSNSWQFTQKLSAIDKKMRPVETVNPLNIYSTAQPSNFHGLINATANNTRRFECLSESFEDIVPLCYQNHFSFFDPYSFIIDYTTAHTGNFSLKTLGSPTIPTTNLVTWIVTDDCTQLIRNTAQPIRDTSNSNQKSYTRVTTKYNTYVLPANNGEPPYSNVDSCSIFALIPNKEYVLSAWVKEANPNNNIMLDYTNANIDIKIGNLAPIKCQPSGQIIDGWQRIEKVFKTPSNVNAPMPFSLSFSTNTNFDDIRIFPADGNMKSFVYNFKDYSLMSILDENNFATFYEYDNEKQLKRVKKETEKGIITIQEVNFSSFKQ